MQVHCQKLNWFIKKSINFNICPFLHSTEKSRLKSTFLPYHVKKHHSTLEMDTFKIMLLLSYLASLDNTPRTWFYKSISRYRITISTQQNFGNLQLIWSSYLKNTLMYALSCLKKVEMNTAIEFWPFIMNFDRGKWPELLEESHEVSISRHVTMMDRYRSLGTPNLDQLVDKKITSH